MFRFQKKVLKIIYASVQPIRFQILRDAEKKEDFSWEFWVILVKDLHVAFQAWQRPCWLPGQWMRLSFWGEVLEQSEYQWPLDHLWGHRAKDNWRQLETEDHYSDEGSRSNKRLVCDSLIDPLIKFRWLLLEHYRLLSYPLLSTIHIICQAFIHLEFHDLFSWFVQLIT